MTKGERVKEIRKVLGLSGEKFGEQLGVSRAAISNIEKGKRNVTDQMFLSICREFNVNEEWLQNGTGKMFVKMNHDEQITALVSELLKSEEDPFKKRLIDSLTSMDEGEQPLKVMMQGERIKMIRKYLNLTQQEFADKIRVKRNTVATYEMGRSAPSASAIALICKEFSVNEDWLRNGTGEMFIQLDEDEQISSFFHNLLQEEKGSFKRQFVTALSHLDDNGWNLLNQFMDYFTQNKKDRV